MATAVHEGLLISTSNVHIDRFNLCLCSVSKNIVVSAHYHPILGEQTKTSNLLVDLVGCKLRIK